MNTMLAMIFGVIMSCCSPQGHSDFHFPSPGGPLRSTTGALMATYQDPGENSDGIHEFSFALLTRSGARLGRFVFTRSVGGFWSLEGNRLAVNNYVGSNETDCLVYNGRSPGLISLTDLIETQGYRSRAGTTQAPIAESRDNSHFYLTCSRWIDNRTLDVAIRGHRDEEAGPGGEFSHSLRFDLNSNMLVKSE